MNIAINRTVFGRRKEVLKLADTNLVIAARAESDLTSIPLSATYWLSDKQPLTDIKNWREVTQANSQKLLVAAADKFPAHDPTENEKQSHITILVHGFNNKFTSDFIRTFAADFLKNRIVSALVFFTTGRRVGVILG